MKLLESIKLAMQVFPNSFINRNNEVVLIPKFNVYILTCLCGTQLEINIK